MQRNTARYIDIPSAKDLESIERRALVACGMPFYNVTFRESGRIAIVKLDDSAFEESRKFSLGFIESNVSRLYGCSLASKFEKKTSNHHLHPIGALRPLKSIQQYLFPY